MSIAQRIKFTLFQKSWTNFKKPPKEVLKDGCDIIGEELSLNGYKYLKSKRLITGKSKNGEFSFQIFLNTNRFNQTGKKVYLNITCSITSRSMGDFRNKHFKPDEPDNVITSFHPGYISKKNDWIRWNLIKTILLKLYNS